MLMNEVAVLKEKQASMIENTQKNTVSIQRVRAAADLMEQLSEKLTQWDEGVIRQLVDTVKVVSAEEIVVYLRGGVDVRLELPCWAQIEGLYSSVIFLRKSLNIPQKYGILGYRGGKDAFKIYC